MKIYILFFVTFPCWQTWLFTSFSVVLERLTIECLPLKQTLSLLGKSPLRVKIMDAFSWWSGSLLNRLTTKIKGFNLVKDVCKMTCGGSGLILGTAQLMNCFPESHTADQPCLCGVLGTGMQENNRGDVFHMAIICT